MTNSINVNIHDGVPSVEDRDGTIWLDVRTGNGEVTIFFKDAATAKLVGQALLEAGRRGEVFEAVQADQKAAHDESPSVPPELPDIPF